MAYVDLNPVRAGVADSLEGSEFTSIQERLQHAKKQAKPRHKTPKPRSRRIGSPESLAPSSHSGLPGGEAASAGRAGRVSGKGGRRRPGRKPVPIDFVAYVDLLEWTGRALSGKGRGRLQGGVPSLLSDLGFDSKAWLDALAAHRVAAATALGSQASLEAHAAHCGRAWVRGAGLAKRLAA